MNKMNADSCSRLSAFPLSGVVTEGRSQFKSGGIEQPGREAIGLNFDYGMRDHASITEELAVRSKSSL